MSATMVPVTMGGITASIQPPPVKCTTRPMTASSTPVARMPPIAVPRSPPADALAAMIGAMNAKLDPR